MSEQDDETVIRDPEMSISFGGTTDFKKQRGTGDTGDFGDMMQQDEKNAPATEDLDGKRKTPSGGKAAVTFGVPPDNQSAQDKSRTYSLRSLKSTRSKKSLRSNRSGNSDLSQSMNEDQTEEKIKNIRVEHIQKIKKLEEDFRLVNVMGTKIDFDVEPGGEKVLTLAKRVASQSQARQSREINAKTPTQQDVDAFLNDDFGVNTITENKCGICGEVNAGKDAKKTQRECEFCGITSCMNCVQTQLRFPRQLVIKGDTNEPTRSLCCRICVSKLFMGEFYLGIPQPEDGPQESLQAQIHKRETKANAKHGDLRER